MYEVHVYTTTHRPTTSRKFTQRHRAHQYVAHTHTPPYKQRPDTNPLPPQPRSEHTHHHASYTTRIVPAHNSFSCEQPTTHTHATSHTTITQCTSAALYSTILQSLQPYPALPSTRIDTKPTTPTSTRWPRDHATAHRDALPCVTVVHMFARDAPRPPQQYTNSTSSPFLRNQSVHPRVTTPRHDTLQQRVISRSPPAQ